MKPPADTSTTGQEITTTAETQETRARTLDLGPGVITQIRGKKTSIWEYSDIPDCAAQNKSESK